METGHSWRQRLLAELPDEAVTAPVAADDPLWEKTETELVKLGSLAHSEVNPDQVAQYCLTLFETRTKDMRVLVQLLRCLQHPATVTPWSTALLMLDDWLKAYWVRAWPASVQQKQRLVVQMLRRFESTQPRVCERASVDEMETIVTLVTGLVDTWKGLDHDKSDMFDGLLTTLLRAKQQHQGVSVVRQAAESAPPPAATQTQNVGDVPLSLDVSSERGWQQTLLKVAEQLTCQQPACAVGYRLRRYAVWHTIASLPVTLRDNQTPLAAVSSDRVNEYQSALDQPDLTVWAQIEKSLTLSPYWFDGHWLSAQVAASLGHPDVAQAIADELRLFLLRLPALKTLRFSDGTPFFPPRCEAWLRTLAQAHSSTDLDGEIHACCQDKGLNAALALLEEKMTVQTAPREKFYTGVMLAELLAAQGMKRLAAAHYHQLGQTAQRLGLAQWEPALVARLESGAQACG